MRRYVARPVLRELMPPNFISVVHGLLAIIRTLVLVIAHHRTRSCDSLKHIRAVSISNIH